MLIISQKAEKHSFLSFRRKPESRNSNDFWTPATLPRRKPGAGVTVRRTFEETITIGVLEKLGGAGTAVQSVL